MRLDGKLTAPKNAEFSVIRFTPIQLAVLSVVFHFPYLRAIILNLFKSLCDYGSNAWATGKEKVLRNLYPNILFREIRTLVPKTTFLQISPSPCAGLREETKYKRIGKLRKFLFNLFAVLRNFYRCVRWTHGIPSAAYSTEYLREDEKISPEIRINWKKCPEIGRMS